MKPLTPRHVQCLLDSFGLGLTVVHHEARIMTGEDAARVIGCGLGQIAKCICIMAEDAPVVVTVSGDREVSEEKLAWHLMVERGDIRIANADECLAVFGYPPEGVPPVAHRTRGIPVMIDCDLSRWPVIYIPAGTANDRIAIGFEHLVQITGGTVIDCTVPNVASPAAFQETYDRLLHLLTEREKELDALYRLASIFSRPVTSLPGLAVRTAETLREAMQLPRCTRVEIVMEGADLPAQPAGALIDLYRARCSYSIDKELTITVSYHETPGIDAADAAIEERERYLVDSTVKLLAEVLERHEMEQVLRESTKTLQRQAAELERKNSALREILSQIEQEKRTILREARNSVDTFIRPYLRQIGGGGLTEEDGLRVVQIEASLDRLFSDNDSMTMELSHLLTPREAEICGLIRNGLSSKEISSFLHISPSTVERHRNTIRKKLALTGTPTNLTTFLRSKA